ncbi:MAG TPA: hypothetical protein VFB12_04535, partial [Ktedonobacteraceae bacterium]|nr:hypothetical protein [Ktedonobacteraceae bacterium]
MLNRYYSWLRKTPLRVIIGCLCIICGLVLVLFLLQPHAAIYPPSTPKANLTLQVSLGFQGDYREEYWTPAQVTIINNGPDFKGTLSVSVFSGPSTTPTLIGSTAPWSYETPVALPKKATKQVTLYIPFYFGNLIPQGFLATLRDVNGKVVATGNSANNQNAIPYAVKTGNLLIGLLADPNADFTALGNASIPNQTSSLTLVPLDAHTLPTMEAALENFDVIVLDNFSSNTLNADQLLALRSWVNRGGVLIEVGGSNWQQTLSSLPADLQPVTVHGTTTLPAGTHLLPVSAPITQTADQSPSPSDKSPETLTVSAATIHTTKENSFSDPETILTSGTNPLIVQAHQGAGVICYLAFDPARAPLASWPATSTLWRAVLFYGMGDHFLVSNIVRGYDSGPGQLLTRGGVLSLLEPELPLGPWIIAVLFLGYLLVLGPIRLLIIRRLKLPMWWSWRIFMASIVLFSLLAYGLAFSQRGAAITENSISIVQINQGGSSAHITTYMGIYTPDNGDVTLHIPGSSLAQTVAQPYLRNNLAVTSNNSITSSIDLPTTTISDPIQTDLTLHELSRWTFNPVIAERDRQLHGALITHLKLLNNKLQGTITNTLETSLSDAYILLPHSIVPVGHIPAGATQQINLPLYSASPNSGKMLA